MLCTVFNASDECSGFDFEYRVISLINIRLTYYLYVMYMYNYAVLTRPYNTKSDTLLCYGFPKPLGDLCSAV